MARFTKQLNLAQNRLTRKKQRGNYINQNTKDFQSPLHMHVKRESVTRSTKVSFNLLKAHSERTLPKLHDLMLRTKTPYVFCSFITITRCSLLILIFCSPEAKADRNPYVYLPFGHGPRNCIGMRFAQMEMNIILARLLKEFKLEIAEETPVPIKPVAQLTLTLTDPLKLRVVKRE